MTMTDIAPVTITCPPELAHWIDGDLVLTGLEVVRLGVQVTIPGRWGDTAAVLACQRQLDALTTRAGVILRNSTDEEESSTIMRDAAVGIARYARQVALALRELHMAAAAGA